MRHKLFTSNKSIIIFFFVTFVAAFLIYRQSFQYFFLQDDWFHLTISKVSNFKEFFNLFSFRTDIIAWRPLSKQLFFLVNYRLFGLNSFPYHVVIFCFFGMNIYLIYKLINNLFKNTNMAMITSFFYATSSIHFISLSWISAGEYVIGTFFWLLSCLVFLFYEKERNIKFYLLSLVIFILCLTSTEFSITFPLVIISYEVLKWGVKSTAAKEINVTNFLKFIPFILIIVVYLYIRLFLFKIPATGNYFLAFDKRIINTIIWYFLWLLNVPEVLKSQIVISKLSISNDPTFIWALKVYSAQIIILIVSFIILAFSLIYVFILNMSKKLFFYTTIAVGFFLLTISPVLLLPTHTFPHYLSIPSISIYAFFAYLGVNNKKRFRSVMLLLLTTSFFLSAYFTVSFESQTYWIPGESSISKEIYMKSKEYDHKIKGESTIVVQPSTKIITQSLMDQNAFQIIYNNKLTRTIYLKKDESFPNLKQPTYLIKPRE